MGSLLAREAIEYALKQDWSSAYKINKKILKDNPKDVEALVRIAKASYELGNTNRAIKYVKKALKLDPLNIIAEKSLCRWQYLNNSDCRDNRRQIRAEIKINSFLEEPGKTQIVPLINLGPLELLSSLSCGESVSLQPRRHIVSITTIDGQYIGRLTDDIASSLLNIIKEESVSHTAAIKYIDNQEVRIIIKQVTKNY